MGRAVTPNKSEVINMKETEKALDICLTVYYSELSAETQAAVREALKVNGLTLESVTGLSLIEAKSPISAANGKPPLTLCIHYDVNGNEFGGLLEIPVSGQAIK
jgi:hypothetical protein